MLAHGRLTAIACDRRLVGGDVGLELGERVREHLLAATVGSGNVVQVRDVRGICRGAIEATPGLEIGVGGRPTCVRVL